MVVDQRVCGVVRNHCILFVTTRVNFLVCCSASGFGEKEPMIMTGEQKVWSTCLNRINLFVYRIDNVGCESLDSFPPRKNARQSVSVVDH